MTEKFPEQQSLDVGQVGVPRGPGAGAEADLSSAVSYKFAGKYYAAKNSSRCATCNSKWRTYIERGLLEGRAIPHILKHVPLADDEPLDVSEASVRNHIDNGHLPFDLAVRRSLVERRAKKIGTLDDAVDTLVDQYALLDMVVMRAFERVATGEVRVGVDQGIKAAEVLSKVDIAQDTSVDAEAAMRMNMEMLATLRAMLTPEEFREFGRRLRETNASGQLPSGASARIIDAEVVDDE